MERLGHVVPAGVANLSRGDVMARVVDDVDRLADLELRVVRPAVSRSLSRPSWWSEATIASPPAGLVLGVAVLVGGVLLPGRRWPRRPASGPHWSRAPRAWVGPPWTWSNTWTRSWPTRQRRTG